MDMHVLSDVPESGHGAVAHVTWTKINDLLQTRLLSANSKVAPLKTISVPRVQDDDLSVGGEKG